MGNGCKCSRISGSVRDNGGKGDDDRNYTSFLISKT